MTTAPASARDVARRFGDVVAVDGVSFDVHPGEIVGLLGANGAGKTTLLRMLLGLLSTSGGSVSLFGKPPTRAARRRMGYMPQGSGLYDDLTVRENLAFVARTYGIPPPSTPALDPVGQALVSELPLGVRKRVAFAAAIAHSPDLLVLDEPTSGVGPLARAELWDSIHTAAEGGAAVLVTTHYMDEAEQCDRLVVLASGREVAAGTVEQIVGGTKTLELETDEPGEDLKRLEAGGMAVLPAGHRLRLPGADPGRIRDLVGDAPLRVRPASLEEVFVLLSTGPAAA